MMPIHVLFVDDHEIVRIGLKQMVQGSEIVISAEASNIRDGYDKFKAGKFDLVIVDVRLPGGDGLQFLAQIKNEKADQNVIVLSSYDNPTYLTRAVSLGANGYLLKSESRERILDGIQKSARGEKIWKREDLRRVTGGLMENTSSSASEVPLTAREGEVLQQLSNGLTNREIAQALGISYETVKEHVQHILRKLGVSDRTQAAVWAVRRNLV